MIFPLFFPAFLSGYKWVSCLGGVVCLLVGFGILGWGGGVGCWCLVLHRLPCQAGLAFYVSFWVFLFLFYFLDGFYTLKGFGNLLEKVSFFSFLFSFLFWWSFRWGCFFGLG